MTPRIIQRGFADRGI
jgi:hypothetical protein